MMRKNSDYLNFTRAPFNNKGATLVELIVSMVILAIVLTAVSGVLWLSLTNYRKNAESLELGAVLQRCTEYIKEKVTVSDTGGLYVRFDADIFDADEYAVRYKSRQIYSGNIKNYEVTIEAMLKDDLSKIQDLRDT